MNEAETRAEYIDPKLKAGKIGAIGYGKNELETIQKMIDAEQSDLFDVLAYISFLTQPITRIQRVKQSKNRIFNGLDAQQKEFLEFVLSKYEENGSEELDEDKLPILLNLKYHAIADAIAILGGVEQIRTTFFNFQKSLYSKPAQANI
jgi:type I restriction enzyme R subunit